MRSTTRRGQRRPSTTRTRPRSPVRPIATSTPATLNAYVDITLPTNAVVPGNLVTFGLKGTGTNSLIVNSRDAATNKPQLVINGGGTPPPTAPVGAFSAAPSSGTAPLTVTFTDQSTNSPTGWAWNFGDPGSGAQNTSTVQNPTHTFASAGNYTVTLTPSNAAGPGTPVTHTINVTPPGGGGEPVLVGAGDIADCTRTPTRRRRQLLDDIAGTVFTAGDNAYENGSAADYANCYDPTWGRHKARTRPAVGNHEYQTPNASGYFGYFGSAAGEPGQGLLQLRPSRLACGRAEQQLLAGVTGGCGTNSPAKPVAAATWLATSAAARSRSGTTRGSLHPQRRRRRRLPLWTALYNAGAELVLAGHRHNYERFAPQTPAGAADASFGIRQFVVGTGGRSLPASEPRHGEQPGPQRFHVRRAEADPARQFV